MGEGGGTNGALSVDGLDRSLDLTRTVVMVFVNGIVGGIEAVECAGLDDDGVCV